MLFPQRIATTPQPYLLYNNGHCIFFVVHAHMDRLVLIVTFLFKPNCLTSVCPVCHGNRLLLPCQKVQCQ